jgi:glyoxylate reductase
MRIFVTQPIAASALERLRAVAEVEVHPDDTKVLAKNLLIDGVQRADILYSLLHDKIDRDVIAANPRLRAITSMAIVPGDIDVAEATARKIPVTVIPPIVTEATADINLGLMIAVSRRMLEGDRFVRAGGFPGGQSNHFAGGGVTGKVLGLVGGAGRIGRAVARRARGFDMRLLYWAPRPRPEVEQELGMSFVPLDRLLAESDFVSIHSPLTRETRHQIGAREIALMKPSACLINTARGPIVDEAALIAALQAGRIAGAGLDVFEFEPNVSPALFAMSNVVLTPHLGSAVTELREVMANVVADNAIAVIEGRRPPNCVNPQVFAD